MNRGQAFTREFAELCKGFCFIMRDGTDGSPIAIDAVAEVILLQPRNETAVPTSLNPLQGGLGRTGSGPGRIGR